MKKSRIITVFMVILATLVFGMATPTSLCEYVGGCNVIGSGHNAAHGVSFGGTVMGMRDGSIRGEWQHTFVWKHNEELTLYRFNGYASFLVCWNDGGPGPDVPRTEPNRAVFGGAGTWRGEPGYLWIAAVADYREGFDAAYPTRSDAYAITIYDDLDGDGVATCCDFIVYEFNDCISSGNIQLFPTTKGHPYIPGVMTAEMERIASTMELCPGC